MELKTKFNLKVFGIGHCNPPLITMPGFGEHLVLHSIPKSKKIVMFREALPCHKGSSIYYVITFGGLGRPLPPHVICNHLDIPPKITKVRVNCDKWAKSKNNVDVNNVNLYVLHTWHMFAYI